MQDNIVLERFQQFKETYISSNIPNAVLLELIESFITSDADMPVEEIKILDGQISLFDRMELIKHAN